MRTHLDLFSGIGGFALAARWAGVETIGFAEIDDYASKVLSKNFPGVTNYGDVRNVPGSVSAWLVAGGFPCQPFSDAGFKKGTSDDRWLWPEMAGVIERVRPCWLLGENVPGIVRMELDTVLSDLERLDYTVWPLVIPAVSVDAPHRRERVWIVGYTERSGFGGQYGRTWQQRQGWRAESTNGSVDVADAERFRQSGQGQPIIVGNSKADCQRQTVESIDGRIGGVWQPEPGVGRVASRLSAQLDGGRLAALWDEEPDIPRVATGIKNRVDRLRGLGNAIVPQVAYNLIRMMIAADEVAEVAL